MLPPPRRTMPVTTIVRKVPQVRLHLAMSRSSASIYSSRSRSGSHFDMTSRLYSRPRYGPGGASSISSSLLSGRSHDASTSYQTHSRSSASCRLLSARPAPLPSSLLHSAFQ